MFSFSAGGDVVRRLRAEGREGGRVVAGARGPRPVGEECHRVRDGHRQGQLLWAVLNRSARFCVWGRRFTTEPPFLTPGPLGAEGLGSLTRATMKR